MNAKKTTREERLAAALRENLRKRKAAGATRTIGEERAQPHSAKESAV